MKILDETSLRQTSYVAALCAGLAGALLMSAFLFFTRTLHGFSPEQILGGSLFSLEGSAGWFAGFTLHLTFGALLGLAYATAFHVSGRTGPARGALFSLAHLLCAGTLIGFLPTPVGPVVAPDFFALNYSWMAFAAYALAHVLYGSVVGAIHARTLAAAIAERLPERMSLSESGVENERECEEADLSYAA